MDVKSSSHNGFYGYIAGVTTAAVLQPLENIKMVLIIPPKNFDASPNVIINLYRAGCYLRKQSGLASFYKGLTPNILKTGFSSAIFFASLRSLEKFKTQESRAGNFICSALGRILSAIASNPFSVVQTRFEMAGVDRWRGSIRESMIRIFKEEGLRGFSKGLLATCYKEGTFAGLYYSLYTEGKTMNLPPLASGILAGIFATALTHPFEIVRTEMQISQSMINHSIWRQLSNIASAGRLGHGLAPRLIKKPLSNTIAFLMFERMEKTP